MRRWKIRLLVINQCCQEYLFFMMSSRIEQRFYKLFQSAFNINFLYANQPYGCFMETLLSQLALQDKLGREAKPSNE